MLLALHSPPPFPAAAAAVAPNTHTHQTQHHRHTHVNCVGFDLEAATAVAPACTSYGNASNSQKHTRHSTAAAAGLIRGMLGCGFAHGGLQAEQAGCAHRPSFAPTDSFPFRLSFSLSLSSLCPNPPPCLSPKPPLCASLPHPSPTLRLRARLVLSSRSRLSPQSGRS